MAHFNPQMCEPSCCVNCAGQIILNEDNCTLCWETSGDVIRAELWRMDTPPVLVVEAVSGCICDPTPGDYELRVFCQVGEGEVTFVVDEDTVPGDWDCTLICKCDCEELQEAGYTGLRVSVTTNADVWDEADGTYFFPFGDGCSGFTVLKERAIRLTGTLNRPDPKSDLEWEIAHERTELNWAVRCSGNTITVGMFLSISVMARFLMTSGNVLDPATCVPTDYGVAGDGWVVESASSNGYGLLRKRERIALSNSRSCVRWYCPDFLNSECTGTLSELTIEWELV
jgi:hypothetical protein